MAAKRRKVWVNFYEDGSNDGCAFETKTDAAESACGVMAGANTPESAARQRQMHADYRSASCDDVAAAVDREMALRAERDALRAQVEAARAVAAMFKECDLGFYGARAVIAAMDGAKLK